MLVVPPRARNTSFRRPLSASRNFQIDPFTTGGRAQTNTIIPSRKEPPRVEDDIDTATT